MRENLEPHLLEFAEKLRSASLVRPFPTRIEDIQREVSEKDWIPWEAQQLHKTPGLLIIDRDFDDFAPRSNPWLHINFRDSMDKYGHVEIFDLRELLNSIADVNNSGGNLFAFVAELQSRERARILLDGLDFKAEFLGISFDVRSGVKYVKALLKDFRSQRT